MVPKRYAVPLLVFATVASHASVLTCDFINLADPAYVLGNPTVRRGLSAAGVRWALGSTETGLWHPLAWLSHMLDVELFGLNPSGHHLTSLVLHVASAVVLFFALRAMTESHWRSLVVAALFALHPLNVEPVAWVAERKDVLGAFLGFVALLAYAAYARRTTAARLGVVVLAFGLALASDTALVTLPLVMLLLDRWPLRRPESVAVLIVEKLPLFALSAGGVLAASLAARGVDAAAPLAHVADTLIASAWYVAKAVAPTGLTVFYPPPPSWPAWEVALAATIVAALTALAIVTARTRPYVLVGWLWFLLTVAPASGLVADRVAYLPTVGLFVVATWGAADMAWSVRPSIAAASVATIFAALAVATGTQVGYWRSSVRLFSHALEVTPENWVAHNQLGDALARQGQLDDAVEQFTEALRLLPRYSDAQYNLGVALMHRGQAAQAIEHYEAALRLDPWSANAHTTLGLALLAEGRDDDAIAHLGEALRLRPDAVAHFDMGFALARAGSLESAIGHYRDAIRLAPDLAEAHYQLAQALATRGRRVEASEHYATAIRLRPEWARSTAGRR